MECNQFTFTDFLVCGCSLPRVWRWSLSLLLAGSIFSVGVQFLHGQGVAPPSYVPKVSEAYFFGDPNEVYPNPHQQSEEALHFEPAAGTSQPVPNREVRMRSRTERREYIRRWIQPADVKGTQKTTDIWQKQRETSAVHWELTYPENAPAPNGRTPSLSIWQTLNGEKETDQKNPRSEKGWETPGITLWNEDGTTEPLPISEEVSIIEDIDEIEFIFEDVPESAVESIKKVKPSRSIVVPKLEEDEEEMQSVLVPVPVTIKTHKPVVTPQTSNFKYDSAIQQVAFFSKPEANSAVNSTVNSVVSSDSQPQTGRRMAYPTRSHLGTSTQSKSAHPTTSTQPSKPSQASKSSRYPISAQDSTLPEDTSYDALRFPWQNRTKGESPDKVAPRNTMTAQMPKKAVDTTETRRTTQVPPRPSVQQVPSMPAERVSETNSHSILLNPAPVTPESVVYTPVFPEKSPTTQRLSPTLPMRKVFEDFGLRKTISRNSLPWYTIYIQELNVNEERLFNSLRLLDQAKLSQSRCPFTLIEAGILASHPSCAAEANRLANIYDNIEYNVLKETSAIDARPGVSQREKDLLKAEKILDFMHQHVLTQGYQLEGTTFGNLLEHGLYNCVTASMLYCALAEKAGLSVTAVELPGHAMCWVYLPGDERLEIETTCSSWFRYRNDPETQKKVICKLIRDASPQLKDQTDQMLLQNVPQPISDKRLIAKIYYNRGVDMLSVNNYAAALEANAMAYCLDPRSKTTEGNLLATMNNWAIALCKEQRFEQAATLLRTGLKYEPTYPPFKNNHTHVYHLWVNNLYQGGQFQEALQIARIADSEQPDVPHFRRLQEQISETIATLHSGTTRH